MAAPRTRNLQAANPVAKAETPLGKYNAKRDFKKTAEPAGELAAKQGRRKL